MLYAFTSLIQARIYRPWAVEQCEVEVRDFSSLSTLLITPLIVFEAAQ